jgi:hypothetical protein
VKRLWFSSAVGLALCLAFVVFGRQEIRRFGEGGWR